MDPPIQKNDAAEMNVRRREREKETPENSYSVGYLIKDEYYSLGFLLHQYMNNNMHKYMKSKRPLSIEEDPLSELLWNALGYSVWRMNTETGDERLKDVQALYRNLHKSRGYDLSEIIADYDLLAVREQKTDMTEEIREFSMRLGRNLAQSYITNIPTYVERRYANVSNLQLPGNTWLSYARYLQQDKNTQSSKYRFVTILALSDPHTTTYLRNTPQLLQAVNHPYENIQNFLASMSFAIDFAMGYASAFVEPFVGWESFKVGMKGGQMFSNLGTFQLGEEKLLQCLAQMTLFGVADAVAKNLIPSTTIVNHFLFEPVMMLRRFDTKAYARAISHVTEFDFSSVTDAPIVEVMKNLCGQKNVEYAQKLHAENRAAIQNIASSPDSIAVKKMRVQKLLKDATAFINFVHRSYKNGTFSCFNHIAINQTTTTYEVLLNFEQANHETLQKLVHYFYAKTVEVLFQMLQIVLQYKISVEENQTITVSKLLFRRPVEFLTLLKLIPSDFFENTFQEELTPLRINVVDGKTNVQTPVFLLPQQYSVNPQTRKLTVKQGKVESIFNSLHNGNLINKINLSQNNVLVEKSVEASAVIEKLYRIQDDMRNQFEATLLSFFAQPLGYMTDEELNTSGDELMNAARASIPNVGVFFAELLIACVALSKKQTLYKFLRDAKILAPYDTEQFKNNKMLLSGNRVSLIPSAISELAKQGDEIPEHNFMYLDTTQALQNLKERIGAKNPNKVNKILTVKKAFE